MLPRSRPTAVLVLVLGFVVFGARGTVAQEDVLSLEGLVVTAAPTPRSIDAVASHVTILGSERLGLFGSRPLGDALREASGVDVVRSGSFGAVTSVYLRGGESDHTLVLVDGVQVNQAGGGFDFADLTTDNVERVEIVRGPASALYGSDAVSGVVHVITKTGRGSPRGSLSFHGGSFGRRDWSGDLQAGTERAGYSASVTRRSTNGVLDLNNDATNTVVTGSARLMPDDATAVALTMRLATREYHFPTDGSGTPTDRNSFTYSDGTTARLSVGRTLSRVVSADASFALNEADGGTDDAPDGVADTLGFYGFTSLDRFRRATGDLRVHLTLDPATVTVGAEYEQARQRSFTETLSEFGSSSGRSESERDNLAYFLHASGDLSAVALSAGGRVEDNETFGRAATWQLGVTWPVWGSAGPLLRASAGSAIKEPTFFESFATGFATGNPDLDPERSRSWEVGVEQVLFSGALTARAAYFDQGFRDLIQYTALPPDPGGPNYFNIARAASSGVELDLAARGARWNGGASWTWLNTEVVDAGFDEGEGATFVEGARLLRRPTHTGTVRMGATFDPLSVDARMTFVGDREDRDFSAFPATPVALPRHMLVSLGGSWRVAGSAGSRPGLTLEVRAENLLDASYEEVFGFPAPGRGLYFGGRVEVGR